MSEQKVKPLSPESAKEAAKASIPDFVIEAVNNLLTKELRSGYATLRQDDIVKEILRVAKLRGEKVTRSELFDNNWLDFEGIYEDAGWEVDYDKPGYYESYEATFDFKDKRKR